MSKNTGGTRLVTILLLLIGAVIVFPMFFTSFGIMGFGPMMDGMWAGGIWGNGTMPDWIFIAGIVMQFLFLATLISGSYLIYLAVTGSASDSDPALEEFRLANSRGELADDKYEQRRETIEP